MSGDKIRIIRIDRHELKRMQVDAYGELSVPHVLVQNDGSAYCDADELRKWRATFETEGKS